ncbi:hypothetical protein SM11_pD0943 (plasmid) [Sinorhizobium meliloti SM11]|uniref:N-acetyltransferase domain-containing protein n=1 Tax=Sinorhizobium meliloti (strain SM11) TaxID=707241 RepID=F7XGU9_SINMM|nr:hypothetical protein SM11_pD0943 [Sinorhizobium meliloti SM11]
MLPGLFVIQDGSYPSCLIMEESIATIRSRARFRNVARGCIPRRAGEVTRKKALEASVGGVCAERRTRDRNCSKPLHDVTEHARDHGVLQLELAVNAENSAAMRFYQRHGFVEVGRIPNGFLGMVPRTTS